MSDEKKPGFYSSDEILKMLMDSYKKGSERLEKMPAKFSRNDGIIDVLDDDYLSEEFGEYKE